MNTRAGRMLVFCAGLLVMLNGTATAADGSWTGSGSDSLWTTAANWDVVPVAGDNAIIDITNHTPVLVNMNVADAYANVYVGRNSSDEVLLTVQNGGALNSGSVALWVAENSGSKARIDMSGGTITGRDVVIGRRGSAVVNVTGGTMNMSRNVVMGDGDGHGVSEFNISAGTVNVAGWTGAGRQSGGMNTINVTGTGYLETGHLSVGLDDGDGTLNISGNGKVKLDAGGSRLRVGEIGNGSTGTINMNGGTLEVDSYISLGHTAGASGSMDMTAGDVSVNAFVVGLGGAGDFTMSGGNLVLNSHVRVGESAGEGVWNMQGGLVEAQNYISAGWGTTGIGEENIINMSGGEFRTGDLEIGRYGDGTVNLSGGVINLNYYGNDVYTNGLVFDSNGGEGLLDITGDGTLNWLGGDFTTEVGAFVLSGDIIASGDGQFVSAVYDSGSNTTVVTAIPEPATLGLLAFLGGTMFWIRRTFMI